MLIRRKTYTFVAAVALAVLGLLATEAFACFSPGPKFEPDPDAPKVIIPQPTLTLEEIKRGGKKEGVTGTCDTYGKISVNVSPIIDMAGYEFVIVEDSEANTPPRGFKVPEAQRPPAGQGNFLLFWDDGLEEKQEPFKFKLKVVTYAPNGDEGPESDPILIEHPGTK